MLGSLPAENVVQWGQNSDPRDLFGIPMQRGMVFTKIIIPYNYKLGRIFANFIFIFLSKNKYAFV